MKIKALFAKAIALWKSPEFRPIRNFLSTQYTKRMKKKNAKIIAAVYNDISS